MFIKKQICFVVLLFLSAHCISVSATVTGEDLICKAAEAVAYGKIFTSGLASQCSGISKITTEADCKLAAEYNRKNNIDKNEGYGGRVWRADFPPGCYYKSHIHNQYYWNGITKSTGRCSNREKCICKTKTCIKCPINTYSEGGTNPTCTPCPTERPTTNFKDGQTSIDSCIPVPTIKCEPGYGTGVFKKGWLKIVNDGITNKKTCVECPINTYSEGGTDPTCTACPANRPTTNFTTGHTSIDSCIPVATIKCEPGTGINLHEKVRVGVKAIRIIPRKKKNSRRLLWGFSRCDGIRCKKQCFRCPVNAYSEGGDDADCNECDKWSHPTTYGKEGSTSCDNIKPGWGFDFKDGKDYKCPINTHSSEGDSSCKPCKLGEVTNPEQTKCIVLSSLFSEIKKDLTAQKEKHNDLSIKNSRLWAKQEQRKRHDEIMKKRKANDNENEAKSCDKELRTYGTVIFPAVEVANEIEINQDTTCIDTNRDEVLKAFCGFRMKLEHLFKNENEEKPAKSFWPNICCKERNDKDNPMTLETCEPPANSNIKRENIIPFALSQGGNYNRHNLYVEVADTIKHEGYLHKGMKELMNHITKKKHHHIHEKINKFFKNTTLCGPRILQSPGKSDRMLCELFLPYHHLLDTMYNFVKHIYVKRYIKSQQASSAVSFLQTMERSFSKRQNRRLGKNAATENTLKRKLKSSGKEEEAKALANSMKPRCKLGSTYDDPVELRNMKKSHCPYKHIDLSDGVATTSVQNIAIHYLRNDLKKEDYTNENMVMLSSRLRYEVQDRSGCPAPLFYADDISIQQVSMNAHDTKEEWVAVIKLNTHRKNGYFQSELKECFAKPYIPRAKVKVNVFVDKKDCCTGNKDYKKCISTKKKCQSELKTIKSKYGDRDYGKSVAVDGAHFKIKGSHIDRRRRRRLLQDRDGGAC